MFYEEGDEDEVRAGRRRRPFAPEESLVGSEADDVPIDVIENTRDRTTREHVSDPAVAREIERR